MWNDLVDAVFLVSLPERRHDRLVLAAEELGKFNTPYRLWEATKNTNGRLGLIQTMSKLFTFCLQQNFKRVLVLEDDAKFIADPIDLLPKCFDQLPQDFHLFYLGCNLAKPPQKISDNILQVKDAYATHAVIYSKQAIELIMRELDKALVYDIFLVNKIQKKEKSYCSYPMLVTQNSGFSDIEQKTINYERFLEKRFYDKTKGL